METYLGKLISIKYKDRTEIITGLLIDFNEHWTLIKSNPVDYVIDGYKLLMTKSIIEYLRGEEEEFTEQVIIAKGLSSPLDIRLPLNDINETLQIISDRFGAFEIEIKDETVCYIGRFINATSKSITIQEISTKARWIECETFQTKDIKIISFDTDYVNSMVLYNRVIENK